VTNLIKQALVRDHDLVADTRAWEYEGAKAVSEQRWLERLEQVFDFVPSKLRQTRTRSAPWKVAVAAYLKATTDVSNPWLAT
jgi:hypothetical protein